MTALQGVGPRGRGSDRWFDSAAIVIENRRQEDVRVALEVEAINPIRIGAFPPNLLYVFVRWEVTCALLPHRASAAGSSSCSSARG